MNKGFSLIGVLVASAIGLIVISGITKLFVHTQSQLNQSELKSQRTNFIGLMGNFLNDPGSCKETLNQVSADIEAGNNTQINKLLAKGGGTFLDIVAEKSQLKSKYGLDGLVMLKLDCAESGTGKPCKKCTGSFPCSPVKWTISLISQTYINGLPSFNRVLKTPIVVTHISSNAGDFVCNKPAFQSINLSDANCPAGEVLQGFDTNGNKVCVKPLLSNTSCPSGEVLTGLDSSGSVVCVKPLSNTSCPSGEVLTGFDSSGSVVCVAQGTNSSPPPPGKTCKPQTIGDYKKECYLPTGLSGSIAGSCQRQGTCRYKCFNGKWVKISYGCYYN